MNFSSFDHECMARALLLARKGLHSTHPNPRVGCVVARDGKVLGAGWHEFAGGPHAEVLALQEAGTAAAGATVYVTLEPCNHHGRTPPCVDALLQAGVERVVIAIEDPNRRVRGAGLQRLKSAGVEVESGLMAAEAEELNVGFFKRMRSGRPWVRVKLACSLDGRTALRNGKSEWISGEHSRRDVQSWRARASAIMTGIGTVLADNPALTARTQEPPLRPLRIIVDTHWRTPLSCKVLESPASALIAGSEQVTIPEELEASGASLLALPESGGRVDLEALMAGLPAYEINELQVEAGATLCGALLKQGLVDEIILYQAPVLLGEGGPGLFSLGVLESMEDRTHLELLESIRMGNDFRLRFRPHVETC